MEDKTFRQQRKKEKIAPEEVGDSAVQDTPTVPVEPKLPQMPTAKLEDVLTVQRQAGVEVPGVQTPVDGVHAKEGIQITGQMPPVMEQMLKRRIAETEGGGELSDMGPATMAPPQQAGPMETYPQLPTPPQTVTMANPGGQPTSDPNLNILLQGLTTQNYESVILPSRGRFYQEADLPSGGEVHIRPMTGQEETILSTARFMRGGRGIEMIMNNCMQEQHINTEKLLSVDRTFLLIYLRAISYGHLYEVSVRCPECNHQFDYDIDLNLPINYCSEEFSPDRLVKTLPKSGYSFQYRLMTGLDETEVSSHRDRQTKYANATDDTFLYRASLLIAEIGNKDVKITNRYAIQSLLQRLPAVDVNYIRNVVNEPPFGVDTEIKVICSACTCEFPVELPYEANFFFPRERTETEQL